MSAHDVTMKDGSVERVEGTDAYHQEGPMTTFFRIASSRQTVDTWSTRIASFRTSEIVAVRRIASAPNEASEPRTLRSA